MKNIIKNKMKRNLTIVFIISITLFSFKGYGTFAEALDTIQNSIFEVDSTESIDNDIKMNININEIEYDNFVIKLSSSEIIENLSVEDEEINVESNSNDEISFDFSKINSNLSTISLSYKIPESLSVGSKITFKLEIINNDNEEDVITIIKEVTITQSAIEDGKDDNENDNNKKDDNEKNENDKIEDKESSIQNNKENQPTNGNNNNKENQPTNSKNNSNQISQNTMSQNAMTKNSTQSSEKIEQVIYNGSDNNYLSNLTVDDYSLNKEFTKESSTYFVSVDNDVTNLSIKATAEDSNSIVKINGNDSLDVGVNKVLITVTAENGNTRNYRIYITRASE